ncbi:tannase/feruloyl esterase family alpha/beta hydrolase [Microbulbifer sp. SH-1]|uniref:tannase/feruloyl esterase family alpha/beta hydrolase n=1 Tax=Microbulbifer sp. SH-1 TaxID=2681547 RepID=UPI00140A95E6|nr:tannase/feruloyl esterase family alpha/beta hydrolase [Microbulbifer sp. SH-1]QIL91263.1 tannase/feruloyl esterase family alpha/beta hydrolase [Microbulbifer sp. SH-1]
MRSNTVKLCMKVGALSGLFITGLFSGVANAQNTPPAVSCAELIGLQVQTGVVTNAVRVSQGDSITAGNIWGGVPVDAAADFCRVSMVLTPTSSSEINVDVWLPDAWNEKMFAYGGGGYSGGLGQSEEGMNDGLARGYVAATSDLGHEAGASVEWALNQPEKVVDFGHRANHLVSVTAKQVINDYYGIPASRAYFQGCSGGGREALMEVSRYPQDYDGVIAGAPPMHWGELMSSQIWRGQVAFWAPNLLNKMSAINAAVMNKCDALDGVTDGVLENPQNCNFDPAVIKCGFFSNNSCLTNQEISALRKIYAGPKLSNGEQVIPGLAVGSEGMGWAAAALTDLAGGEQYYKYMVYNNSWWSGFGFNLDTDYPNSRALVQPIVNSDDPDISAFAQNGGKLIIYHGWNDAIVPGANSVRYYESVANALGPNVQDNVRLFMMPGQQHCAGSFDAVQHLENWVEQGQAPDRIVVTDEGSTSNHPACPWPQTAHYNGSGSSTDAASYSCM